MDIAEQIVKQSWSAPRNIFSKVKTDAHGNTIYSYDKKEDLKEENKDDFSYEWLPKQDYDNLILGKYCSCCAHLLGAGAGIMRASMILDNCQNLVIRNELGTIIAKMTIYVNKEKGYAVFNTAEINAAYNSDIYFYPICQTFIRGVHAFVKRYNENNEIPLTIITIGEYRNHLKEQLGNIESALLPTPDYSDYGYYAEKTQVGTYNGDAKQKQILVYKRNN